MSDEVARIFCKIL